MWQSKAPFPRVLLPARVTQPEEGDWDFPPQQPGSEFLHGCGRATWLLILVTTGGPGKPVSIDLLDT